MLYTGPPLADGPVSLASVRDADVHEWAERAVSDPSMLYFGIFRSDVLVGQIFLHDRDDTLQEALVGYHLFTATNRGQGIGTRALRLLQRHVTDHLDLKRLIVITSRDNIPSQRLALTCGFALAGAPREDPTGLLYGWKVSRQGSCDSSGPTGR
ncbi:GNAT family protein [Kribbella ginsengisoli]|uniref:N-acetyltransferase domain-containing protein n=1 Tax=Kribbella ginsengisoli TaxID=363865 RepID=A0ABP6Z6R2_9ACTN